MKVRKKTFNNQNQAAIYAEELRNKGAYDVVCLPKDGTQKYIVYAYYLQSPTSRPRRHIRGEKSSYKTCTKSIDIRYNNKI